VLAKPISRSPPTASVVPLTWKSAKSTLREFSAFTGIAVIQTVPCAGLIRPALSRAVKVTPTAMRLPVVP